MIRQKMECGSRRSRREKRWDLLEYEGVQQLYARVSSAPNKSSIKLTMTVSKSGTTTARAVSTNDSRELVFAASFDDVIVVMADETHCTVRARASEAMVDLEAENRTRADASGGRDVVRASLTAESDAGAIAVVQTAFDTSERIENQLVVQKATRNVPSDRADSFVRVANT